MNEPVPPIPAATLILMRRGTNPPELLAMERAARMAFAPGAIVFPGGRVEADDHLLADPDRLSLTTTVDASEVAADVSVSLGLIVTELVINALKHAFPGQDAAGAITVDYARQGGDWTLAVGDNGAGMPPDYAEAKHGLGTGIVEALSKQLGASVIVADANPGTKVSIVHAEDH